MVIIKNKNVDKKLYFKDLTVGDYFFFTRKEKEKPYLKCGIWSSVSLSNGKAIITDEYEEIIPIKNITIDYEV